jgi:uncharacterized protein
VVELLTAVLAFVPHSPWFYAVGLVTIFATALSKGAFGGGLPIVVPGLALVVDPVSAAIIAAPLLVFMDIFTVRAFGRSNWSWLDLKFMLPGLVGGLLIGWALFEFIDRRIVVLIIAVVTMLFAIDWFLRQRKAAAGDPIKASLPLGGLAGLVAGFTTFIAHAGGPPVMMYLLKRGMDKSVLAGTMAMFFLVANCLKMPPYAFLFAKDPPLIGAALVLAPVVPLGVFVGKIIHDRLDQKAIYLWSHILLLFVGGKMLFDASRAFL